ncbi:hypothetical protein [Rhizobium sp. SYY.PMSO]|uniref:hypothetical protein n=1 Tax=Rhizobium sp. SYY.PMSO TaxID=3382192 RepID=UPI00399019F6
MEEDEYFLGECLLPTMRSPALNPSSLRSRPLEKDGSILWRDFFLSAIAGRSFLDAQSVHVFYQADRGGGRNL